MKTSAFIIVFLISLTAIGQNVKDIDAKKHYNLNSNDVALDGYDLVRYFENNEPKRGKSNFGRIIIRFLMNSHQMKTA